MSAYASVAFSTAAASRLMAEATARVRYVSTRIRTVSQGGMVGSGSELFRGLSADSRLSAHSAYCSGVSTVTESHLIHGASTVYHLICCDPDVALCGEDVSDVPFRELRANEVLCPLCKLAEDEDYPCPGCWDYQTGGAQ